VGVKTNIDDEGRDVFYLPTFYNEQQAYDILQQLKTEIVNESTKCSSFIPDWLSSSFIPEGLSLNSTGHQVATGDKGSKVCKKPMGHGPWSPILMKIRDDIEEALRIRLNLCLADWHQDGHDVKGITMDNGGDIDIGSSIIWMSFGAPRDLLLKYQFFQQ